MQLTITPVGERALIQEPEIHTGDEATLFDALDQVITDLGEITQLEEEGEDGIESLEEYDAIVSACDLPKLVVWFNEQVFEYQASITKGD